MSTREPWDLWVLGALRDGKPAHLKGIYAAIEGLKDGGYINPQLYGVEADGDAVQTIPMSSEAP